MFTLELYYENNCDREFAISEAAKFRAEVTRLAPRVDVGVQVLKTAKIIRARGEVSGEPFDVPNVEPSSHDCQSLLITSEPIKLGDRSLQGLAGNPKGCISKPAMEDKTRRGGNSADITIHEWLHTVAGTPLNGHRIPNPDSAQANGFTPTVGPDGEHRWDDWYRYMLRG
jgi:hypothetical protein